MNPRFSIAAMTLVLFGRVSFAANADSAATNDSLPVTPHVPPLAAATAAMTRAPSTAMLATLRTRSDGHMVRIWMGSDAYDVRRARFGPAGVAFSVADAEGVP